MRREENLELIQKLAQARVDTSLLHSSRRLGTTNESKRDVLARAYREREAGITPGENDSLLSTMHDGLNGKIPVPSSSDDESGSSVVDDVHDAVSQEMAASDTGPVLHEEISFGSGLKRPLELGGDGRPLIRKRQRKMRPEIKVVTLNGPNDVSEDSGSEWEGFSDTEEATRHSQIDAHPESSEDDSSSTGDSEDETDEADAQDNEEVEERPEGTSGFKAWAIHQRNAALGFTPSADTVIDIPQVSHQVQLQPRPPDVDPLPPELQIPENQAFRKAHSVHVERSADVQEARLALPVVAEEQKIMEAVHNHDVVVIWGATGSGKTTQVPQFLFEAGYGDRSGPTPGMIGITQPRRVAAVSMSDRVGNEMGALKRKVAYQVLYRSCNVTSICVSHKTDPI